MEGGAGRGGRGYVEIRCCEHGGRMSPTVVYETTAERCA